MYLEQQQEEKRKKEVQQMKIRVANRHYKRSILRYYGFGSWKVAVLEVYRDQQIRSFEVDVRNCKARGFKVWMKRLSDKRAAMEEKAVEWRDTRLKKAVLLQIGQVVGRYRSREAMSVYKSYQGCMSKLWIIGDT